MVRWQNLGKVSEEKGASVFRRSCAGVAPRERWPAPAQSGVERDVPDLTQLKRRGKLVCMDLLARLLSALVLVFLGLGRRGRAARRLQWRQVAPVLQALRSYLVHVRRRLEGDVGQLLQVLELARE